MGARGVVREVGPGLVVSGGAAHAEWLDEACLMLGPLFEVGVRGSFTLRDVGGADSFLRWAGELVLPSGREVAVTASRSSRTPVGWLVQFGGSGPLDRVVLREHADPVDGPSLISGWVWVLTLLAYERAATDGVWERSRFANRAQVKRVEAWDGVFTVSLSRNAAEFSQVAVKFGKGVSVGLRSGWRAAERTLDMGSEVDAAHLGRALGFAGRAAQVARSAREWLADVELAPDRDADLQGLSVRRA